MRVLITRPLAPATALAARLAALGHDAVVDPLLTIVADGDAGARLRTALVGSQALLFTSTNGVTSFAAVSGRRDIPAYAVGDGTAAAARQACFAGVESAQGDVEALVTLVSARLKSDGGALVHASGHAVAGDLARRLTRLGFTVRSVPLYRAVAADGLGAVTVAAFQAGQIDAALFFSPRTAATFVRLAAAAGIGRYCVMTAAMALSPAVAAELQGLGWRRVAVAEEPTEAALLEALSRLGAERRGSGARSS